MCQMRRGAEFARSITRRRAEFSDDYASPSANPRLGAQTNRPRSRRQGGGEVNGGQRRAGADQPTDLAAGLATEERLLVIPLQICGVRKGMLWLNWHNKSEW